MPWIVLRQEEVNVVANLAEAAADRAAECQKWVAVWKVEEWVAADQEEVAEEWVADEVECPVVAVVTAMAAQVTEVACSKRCHLNRSLHCRKIEGKTNLCTDCCKAYRVLASASMFIPNAALG